MQTGKGFLLCKLNKNLITNLLNTINILCTSITVLIERSLKHIANIFDEEIICLSSRFKYIQCYLVVLDATKSKLHSLFFQKME